MKPIVVLFTGHCGSTWFVDMLGRQSWCVRLGFEPVDQANRKHAAALPDLMHSLLLWNPQVTGEHLFEKFFGPNKHIDHAVTHYCFKTRLCLEQKNLFGKLIPQIQPATIHIRRKNKFKSAVSNFKRERLGISHLVDLDKNAEKIKPIRVECDYVIQKIEQFLWREALIELYKRYIRFEVETIFYEDLVADTEGVLARVGRRLGVRMDAPLSVYKKMTKDDLREAVANYDELVDAIRESKVAFVLSDATQETVVIDDILSLKRPTSRTFYSRAKELGALFGDLAYLGRIEEAMG